MWPCSPSGSRSAVPSRSSRSRRAPTRPSRRSSARTSSRSFRARAGTRPAPPTCSGSTRRRSIASSRASASRRNLARGGQAPAASVPAPPWRPSCKARSVPEDAPSGRTLGHVHARRPVSYVCSSSMTDPLEPPTLVAPPPPPQPPPRPEAQPAAPDTESMPRLRGRTPLPREQLRLSVLIPVYNERNTIELILDQVHAVPVPKEVICVNDRSTDGTGDILDRLAAAGRIDRLIHHEVNRGKGAAIRTALAASTGNVVIVQDADLEYDPADWPALLDPIVEGQADAVFGSRFLGGPHRVLYFWHSVGNAGLTMFSNMFTNLNLTDMETCYKAVRGEVARSLRLTSDRFGFEPEITARLARANARIYEVPISYSGRTYAEGKKIGWKDGVAAIWHIVKFNVFD